MIEQEWWKNKLAEDIYATLKAKEQSLPQFKAQSPQLWIRRHLVDWLAVVVGELRVCPTAQHLGIYLMDHFMDSLEVEQSQLHHVAIVCLLIAVKFEDYCDRVPHFTRLNSYLPNSDKLYRGAEYLAMELTVLKLIDWDLCVPTVAHFLPYFLKVAVDEDDLRNGMPISSKVTVESYLEKHALYFQEICLQDHTFRDFSPSLIAAACVASARICLHLTPTWPKQMELMTDYYLEELLPCVQNMLGTHQQDGHQQTIPSTVISPYTSSGYCSPIGMSPSGYLPALTSSMDSVCATTNMTHRHLPPFNEGESFARNLYNISFKSDVYYSKSDVYRNYQQSSLISRSYVPYNHPTSLQKHCYRNVQPLVFNSVISYSSPSATQIGPKLLPGCRGS